MISRRNGATSQANDKPIYNFKEFRVLQWDFVYYDLKYFAIVGRDKYWQLSLQDKYVYLVLRNKVLNIL